jgi:hypothetical protein
MNTNQNIKTFEQLSRQRVRRRAEPDTPCHEQTKRWNYDQGYQNSKTDKV